MPFYNEWCQSSLFNRSGGEKMGRGGEAEEMIFEWEENQEN